MDDLVSEGLEYKRLYEQKENNKYFIFAGGILLGWLLACWVLLV